MRAKKIIVILFVSLLFFSCRKNLRDQDTNTEVVSDYLLSDRIAADLFYSTLSAVSGDSIYLSNCYATSIFGSTTTLRFDSAGCGDVNGFLKKGSLKITASPGALYTNGGLITVECIKYEVNGNKIDGTLTIKSKGINARNNPLLSVSASGLRISQSPNPIYLNLSRNAEWMEGDSTSSVIDDVFNWTGSSSGYLTKGTPFESQIDSICGVKAPCLFFSNGISTLKPGSLASRKIIWGNSLQCNTTASVEWNDKSESVTFP